MSDVFAGACPEPTVIFLANDIRLYVIGDFMGQFREKALLQDISVERSNHHQRALVVTDSITDLLRPGNLKRVFRFSLGHLRDLVASRQNPDGSFSSRDKRLNWKARLQSQRGGRPGLSVWGIKKSF